MLHLALLLAIYTARVARAAAHKLQWAASVCTVVICSTQMSFQGRLAALEGKYFREEEVLATRRAVEKLIEEGKLPSDALKALDEAQSRSSGIPSTSHDDDSPSMHNLPTTVNRGRQGQQGFAAVPAQLHAAVLSGASMCCRQGVVYNHVPGVLPGAIGYHRLGVPPEAVRCLLLMPRTLCMWGARAVPLG